MKLFFIKLFFGGDDLASEVFHMLASRMKALRQTAERQRLEQEVAEAKIDEQVAVKVFVGQRKNVHDKLFAFGE